MKVLKSSTMIFSMVLIGLSLLLSIYFLYYFNPLWGMRHFALVLAFPLVITSLLALTAVYLMIRKKIWYAGLIVIIISTGMFFSFFTQLKDLEIGPILRYPPSSNSANQKLGIEEEILRIIFVNYINKSQDGKYVVISSNTQIQDTREIIGMNLNEQMNSIYSGSSKLLDDFFNINKKSFKLTIDSSPEDGYVIDYQNEVELYFEKYKPDNWDNWRNAHPDARGIWYVSWPAYDPRTGLAIVYVGTQGDWLLGSDYLYLFKYNNGKLIQIKCWLLGIS